MAITSLSKKYFFVIVSVALLLPDETCQSADKVFLKEAQANSAETTRWLKTTHFSLRTCQPLQDQPDPKGTGTYQGGSKTFREVPMCLDPTKLPYDHYHFPNAFGQGKIEQVLEALYLWWPIVSSGCSSYLPSLLCSLYMPACFPLMPNKGVQPNILPCRETCESVRASCDDVVVKQANLTWPSWLNCALFPPKRMSPSDLSIAETIQYKNPVCLDFTDEQHVEHELLVHVDKVREDARRRAFCRCHCFSDPITNATGNEPFLPKGASNDEKQKWRDRVNECNWGCGVGHYTFGVCYHELDTENLSIVVKLTAHRLVGWVLAAGILISLVVTAMACAFSTCCERRSGGSRLKRRASAEIAGSEGGQKNHRAGNFYSKLFSLLRRPFAIFLQRQNRRRAISERSHSYRYIVDEVGEDVK